jgi:hypothetical protein
VLARSRSRFRGRAQPSGWINTAAFYGATDAWDFTTDQYLRGGTFDASGLTVTRASPGFAETTGGVLIPFASGELRRTNKGALIEGARTNLLKYSQALNTNLPWELDNSGATNPVVTPNYGTAPDGTFTADRIQLDKTGGLFSRIQQQLTGLASSIYTFSVYMRTFTGTANVGIRIEGTGVNCVVTTTWQRFTVSLPSAGTAASSQILLFDNIPGNDDTADVLVWGAQTEAAAFPSSYIVTEGTTVTRAADVVTAVPTSGTDYPLSLFAEFQRTGDTGAEEGVFSVDDGDATDRADLIITSADQFAGNCRAGNVGQGSFSVSGISIAVGTIYKGAARFATNDMRSALNGTLGGADTVATMPATPVRCLFGASATSQGFSYIRRAAIVNRALSNAELQGITA